MESKCAVTPYRGFESRPLRQKHKGPDRGLSFLEEGMGLRTLFDSGSGGAASEHAQRALRASARLTGEPPIGRRIHPGISVINNGTEWVHFFLEEGMGVRTLFDSRRGVAASEHAQRAFHCNYNLNLYKFSELSDCSQYGNMLGCHCENHCY